MAWYEVAFGTLSAMLTSAEKVSPEIVAQIIASFRPPLNFPLPKE